MKNIELAKITEVFKIMSSEKPSFSRGVTELYKLDNLRDQIEFFNITESEWELLNTPTLTRHLARHTYMAFKQGRRLVNVCFMVMTKDMAFNYESGSYEIIAYGYNNSEVNENHSRLVTFFNSQLEVKSQVMRDLRQYRK